MSQRQPFPQPQLTGNETRDAQPAQRVVAHAHRRPAPQVNRHRLWLLLGMSVLVAPDDTIWFAEQAANYLGHYDPATRHYQLYPLPWLTVPDPARPKQVQLLPSAPNELALDGHGDIWFTEFNADRLGRLDPR